MSRIFHAMTRYPELVAGDERFCIVLMQAFQGAFIGKLGADGAMGISVKIEDGNVDILHPAVVKILEQLAIGTAEM